jgi:lycopene cyclase domain-containing protein
VEKYLYLFIDFASILFPFLFSFYPKANFSHKWKYLWPAIVVSAIVFVAWDSWFTRMGVWGFSPRYTTGIQVFYLPVEEILFFICIPYACVFTYEAVNYFRKTEPLPKNGRWVTWILVAGLLTVAVVNYDRWYPAVTFAATAFFLLYLVISARPYLGRFYFAFIFILIPFFLVNGILTGTGLPEPVVWYNNEENLGIRMGTIPLEDTFYGMLLILMNVSIFEYLQKRSKQNS